MAVCDDVGALVTPEEVLMCIDVISYSSARPASLSKDSQLRNEPIHCGFNSHGVHLYSIVGNLYTSVTIPEGYDTFSHIIHT